MKKALIFYGGWDGHTPKETAHLFAEILRGEGFETVLADPANPVNLLYEYTKADGLHPYEGYSAMADSIDLNMFLE